jgi:hypothetical protein
MDALMRLMRHPQQYAMNTSMFECLMRRLTWRGRVVSPWGLETRPC